MTDFIKASARVIHFISIGLMASFLTGTLLADSISVIPKWHRRLADISGVGFILSGLINWWILKAFKPQAEPKDFKIWTAIIHSKLLLVIIFFTPIIRVIVKDENTKNTIRIVLSLVFAAASPFVRKLRESYSPKNQGASLSHKEE